MLKELFKKAHQQTLKTMGGGVITAHTTLTARKKVLNEEGQRILDSGVCTLQDLAQTRPELWDYTKEAHRFVRDKVVTDVFCEDIVDNLIAEVSTFGDYKYHHSGTGVGAEAAANTALGTPELDARTVGTQVEDSSKVYKSIATETFDGVAAITEHGLFNTAGAGGPPVVGGILMDRTLFAAINVVSGNQIEWTFTLALASGG